MASARPCCRRSSSTRSSVASFEAPPPLGRTQSALFTALNRGKRSMTLNLKSEAGRALLLDLARRADVLIEGFRPGVMKRLAGA